MILVYANGQAVKSPCRSIGSHYIGPEAIYNTHERQHAKGYKSLLESGWESDPETLFENPAIECKFTNIEFNEFMVVVQVVYCHHERKSLGNDGGQGCTFNSPSQFDNEEQVESDVEYGENPLPRRTGR